MKEIVLKRGEVCLVDDEDFEILSQYKWRNHKGYAEAQIEGKTVRMHNMLKPRPEGYVTHHRNEKTLDNRKCNLQVLSVRVHRRHHHQKMAARQGAEFKEWYKANKMKGGVCSGVMELFLQFKQKMGDESLCESGRCPTGPRP